MPITGAAPLIRRTSAAACRRSLVRAGLGVTDVAGWPKKIQFSRRRGASDVGVCWGGHMLGGRKMTLDVGAPLNTNKQGHMLGNQEGGEKEGEGNYSPTAAGLC